MPLRTVLSRTAPLVTAARSFHSTPALGAGRQGVNNNTRIKFKKAQTLPTGHYKPFVWKKMKAVHRAEYLRERFEAIKDLPVIHMKQPVHQAWVHNLQAEPVGLMDLDSKIWGQEIRPDIVHRVVRWQRNRWRQGTHMTKTRAEKSGGGRKPHPQKGSGRARQGSTRSPLNQGGGQAHAKRNRDYSFILPQKVLRMGLSVALSAKFKENNLYVVQDTVLESHKTAELAELMAEKWAHIKPGMIAVLTGEEELDANFALAARNMWNMDFYTPSTANVYDLVKRHHLIITETGVKEMQAILSKRHPKTRIKFVVERPVASLSEIAHYKVTKKKRHLAIAQRNRREQSELRWRRQAAGGEFNRLEQKAKSLRALYQKFPHPTLVGSKKLAEASRS